MMHFGLFVSVLQNWIQLHVSVICSFSPRGYSRIEEMRKCQSHDLTAFILENKSKEKEGGKEIPSTVYKTKYIYQSPIS